MQVYRLFISSTVVLGWSLIPSLGDYIKILKVAQSHKWWSQLDLLVVFDANLLPYFFKAMHMLFSASSGMVWHYCMLCMEMFSLSF